jgi:hypothetical protein
MNLYSPNYSKEHSPLVHSWTGGYSSALSRIAEPTYEGLLRADYARASLTSFGEPITIWLYTW